MPKRITKRAQRHIKAYDKRLIAAAVVLVLAVVVLAMNAYLFEGCILGNYAYAGQAVDKEQALAKLEGFAGNIDRTKFNANPVPTTSLDFSRAAVEKVAGTKAVHEKSAITLSGYAFSVPQKNPGFFAQAEGFYLSDADGNLYSLKDPRCV